MAWVCAHAYPQVDMDRPADSMLRGLVAAPPAHPLTVTVLDRWRRVDAYLEVELRGACAAHRPPLTLQFVRTGM